LTAGKRDKEDSNVSLRGWSSTAVTGT